MSHNTDVPHITKSTTRKSRLTARHGKRFRRYTQPIAVANQPHSSLTSNRPSIFEPNNNYFVERIFNNSTYFCYSNNERGDFMEEIDMKKTLARRFSKNVFRAISYWLIFGLALPVAAQEQKPMPVQKQSAFKRTFTKLQTGFQAKRNSVSQILKNYSDKVQKRLTKLIACLQGKDTCTTKEIRQARLWVGIILATLTMLSVGGGMALIKRKPIGEEQKEQAKEPEITPEPKKPLQQKEEEWRKEFQEKPPDPAAQVALDRLEKHKAELLKQEKEMQRQLEQKKQEELKKQKPAEKKEVSESKQPQTEPLTQKRADLVQKEQKIKAEAASTESRIEEKQRSYLTNKLLNIEARTNLIEGRVPKNLTQAIENARTFLNQKQNESADQELTEAEKILTKTEKQMDIQATELKELKGNLQIESISSK